MTTEQLIHRTEDYSASGGVNDKTIFGFWVYLMSDCLLFASLFAVYAVLQRNTYGGPSGADIFNLPFVFWETAILLISSFACGLSLVAAYRNKKQQVLLWLGVTFVLGFSFVALELNEFMRFIAAGASWQRSGFLSSFFTLVGTHGLHVSVGLLLMLVLSMQLWKRGLTETTMRRLTCLTLFWHFLDVIWIFIFTIVYLFGLI